MVSTQMVRSCGGAFPHFLRGSWQLLGKWEVGSQSAAAVLGLGPSRPQTLLFPFMQCLCFSWLEEPKGPKGPC